MHETPAYLFVLAEVGVPGAHARTAPDSGFFFNLKNLAWSVVVVCVDKMLYKSAHDFIGVVDVRDYPPAFLELNRHDFSFAAFAERIVEDLPDLNIR